MADVQYKMTIGLEVHVELATKTKMFCQSLNDPDEKIPNVNICPVCLGHPGTLPTINKEAVRSVLRVGLALGGTMADFTEFDRKNYFYPDIPKGYQISQYKYPLISGGSLADIDITRIHLEEDTARSQHDPKTGASLVDYNRAGVPLMELVTEPVIHSAKQAGDFARELNLLLGPRYLAVSEANLEKGEMRIEANISLSNKEEELGTKVEVKNLNSFKAVEKAIEYEYERQKAVLSAGDKVVQETRGWDENKAATFSQRLKEFSHDYRYFPDPDLPKLKLSQITEWQDLSSTLPELPKTKRQRLKNQYDIKDSDIEVFVFSPEISDYFESVVTNLSEKSNWQLAANYTVSDLVGFLASDLKKLPPVEYFTELINLLSINKISSRGAKDILSTMMETNESPTKIAEENNLWQKSDEGELIAIIEKVIDANPDIVTEFKSGKEKALQFLIGQGMKESKGSANPNLLAKLFISKLKE